MFQFDVVTLFPEMFDAVTESGVTGRARERRLFELVAWNPRAYAANSYRTVDDRPYGGGPGMVMMAEPLEKALEAARQRQASAGVKRTKVVYLTPQGRLLNHRRVMEWSALQGLVLLAGRYEGVDERLIGRAVDEEISIGDYVLSGGELAAMVVIDALVRQMPGALGDAESASQDSFVDGLLDYPHYTRPEVYANEGVPSVLLSGNHAQIARWRLKQSLGRTWVRRPELLAQRTLSELERALLDEYRREMETERAAVKAR
jgi:tRNA (guanine37-N1)-methyltransferase